MPGKERGCTQFTFICLFRNRHLLVKPLWHRFSLWNLLNSEISNYKSAQIKNGGLRRWSVRNEFSFFIDSRYIMRRSLFPRMRLMSLPMRRMRLKDAILWIQEQNKIHRRKGEIVWFAGTTPCESLPWSYGTSVAATTPGACRGSMGRKLKWKYCRRTVLVPHTDPLK